MTALRNVPSNFAKAETALRGALRRSGLVADPAVANESSVALARIPLFGTLFDDSDGEDDGNVEEEGFRVQRRREAGSIKAGF